MNDKLKKALKIGGLAALAGAAGYGGYKAYQHYKPYVDAPDRHTARHEAKANEEARLKSNHNEIVKRGRDSIANKEEEFATRINRNDFGQKNIYNIKNPFSNPLKPFSDNFSFNPLGDKPIKPLPSTNWIRGWVGDNRKYKDK